MTTTQASPLTTLDAERADLLETLAAHRAFLRLTVHSLSDEQARLRPTASELTLGGLIKHVAATESQWVDFIEQGSSAMAIDSVTEEEWSSRFELLPGETLKDVLDHYTEVADRTDALVASLADLSVSHELPSAPWFTPGARRSARRVFLHIVAETAQHAGHADILRETLDGQKTMG